MRAAVLLVALLAAGCSSPNGDPSTSPSGDAATTGQGPTTGATTSAPMAQRGEELASIRLTVAANPTGGGYELVARAENLGTEPWYHYPACEMAWRHNMTDTAGSAFNYRSVALCAGSPTEPLDPGESHTLTVPWTGTRYAEDGTESQVDPGTYLWNVQFRAGPETDPVAYGVSATLEVQWPPPA